ncbi:MAG: hypothetical protein K0Q48_2281 [Bacillota bacterium]|jgi:hypothetical protein|nr:hypothetical protein [Bacillota bacterium]
MEYDECTRLGGIDMNSITKNYAILLLVLLILGLFCILKSYAIGMFFLTNSPDGWDIYQVNYNVAGWIVFGGVISLLSGYGLIKIMLKYIS